MSIPGVVPIPNHVSLIGTVSGTVTICAHLQVSIVAVPGPQAGIDVVMCLLLVAVIVLFTVSTMATLPVVGVVIPAVGVGMIIVSAALLGVDVVLRLLLVRTLHYRHPAPNLSSGITLLGKAISKVRPSSIANIFFSYSRLISYVVLSRTLFVGGVT